MNDFFYFGSVGNVRWDYCGNVPDCTIYQGTSEEAFRRLCSTDLCFHSGAGTEFYFCTSGQWDTRYRSNSLEFDIGHTHSNGGLRSFH